MLRAIIRSDLPRGLPLLYSKFTPGRNYGPSLDYAMYAIFDPLYFRHLIGPSFELDISSGPSPF